MRKRSFSPPLKENETKKKVYLRYLIFRHGDETTEHNTHAIINCTSDSDSYKRTTALERDVREAQRALYDHIPTVSASLLIVNNAARRSRPETTSE